LGSVALVVGVAVCLASCSNSRKQAVHDYCGRLRSALYDVTSAINPYELQVNIDYWSRALPGEVGLAEAGASESFVDDVIKVDVDLENSVLTYSGLNGVPGGDQSLYPKTAAAFVPDARAFLRRWCAGTWWQSAESARPRRRRHSSRVA